MSDTITVYFRFRAVGLLPKLSRVSRNRKNKTHHTRWLSLPPAESTVELSSSALSETNIAQFNYQD